MKVVCQRVTQAAVTVDGEVVGAIEQGLLLLVGIAAGDTQAQIRQMADKVVGLRIFDDPDGKMNLSVRDAGGSILAVSQFTLLADTRKGRRPSFMAAAPPDQALTLFESFVQEVQALGIPVQTGRFRAMMKVSLINDGPVTILLDSSDWSA